MMMGAVNPVKFKLEYLPSASAMTVFEVAPFAPLAITVAPAIGAPTATVPSSVESLALPLLLPPPPPPHAVISKEQAKVKVDNLMMLFIFNNFFIFHKFTQK